MNVKLISRAIGLFLLLALIGSPLMLRAESADVSQTTSTSIAEIAVDNGFSTLVAALDAADLVPTFADCAAGPFTVFAPTDDAFAALPDGTLDALLADPSGLLTDILTYHVVDGAVPAEVVVTLDSATTLLGEDVTIEVINGGVVLNGSVNVLVTDVMACNGIVHVIDAVLIPPVADNTIDDLLNQITEAIIHIIYPSWYLDRLPSSYLDTLSHYISGVIEEQIPSTLSEQETITYLENILHILGVNNRGRGINARAVVNESDIEVIDPETIAIEVNADGSVMVTIQEPTAVSLDLESINSVDVSQIWLGIVVILTVITMWGVQTSRKTS